MIPALTKICGYCGARQGDVVVMNVGLDEAKPRHEKKVKR